MLRGARRNCPPRRGSRSRATPLTTAWSFCSSPAAKFFCVAIFSRFTRRSRAWVSSSHSSPTARSSPTRWHSAWRKPRPAAPKSRSTARPPPRMKRSPLSPAVTRAAALELKRSSSIAREGERNQMTASNPDAERLIALLSGRAVAAETLAEADWQRIVAIAQQQGVGPILYARLQERGVTPSPATAQRLREIYLASIIRNTRLLHEVGNILRAFAGRRHSGDPPQRRVPGRVGLWQHRPAADGGCGFARQVGGSGKSVGCLAHAGICRCSSLRDRIGTPGIPAHAATVQTRRSDVRTALDDRESAR